MPGAQGQHDGSNRTVSAAHYCLAMHAKNKTVWASRGQGNTLKLHVLARDITARQKYGTHSR